MENTAEEKIQFQCVMSYKAYRKIMITRRVCVGAAATGASLALCALSIVIGIIVAVMVALFFAISILVSVGNEQSYTIYNTRVVIKRRGDYGRRSVPMDKILRVDCKVLPLEKSLKTCTIVITAKNEKGKTKKYKLKHVFNAAPIAEYLSVAAADNVDTTK